MSESERFERFVDSRLRELAAEEPFDADRLWSRIEAARPARGRRTAGVRPPFALAPWLATACVLIVLAIVVRPAKERPAPGAPALTPAAQAWHDAADALDQRLAGAALPRPVQVTVRASLAALDAGTASVSAVTPASPEERAALEAKIEDYQRRRYELLSYVARQNEEEAAP